MLRGFVHDRIHVVVGPTTKGEVVQTGPASIVVLPDPVRRGRVGEVRGSVLPGSAFVPLADE